VFRPDGDPQLAKECAAWFAIGPGWATSLDELPASDRNSCKALTRFERVFLAFAAFNGVSSAQEWYVCYNEECQPSRQSRYDSEAMVAPMNYWC
jgi:hypothetical protein